MPSSTYHRVGRSEGAEGEGEGGAEHCDVVGLRVCALSAAGQASAEATTTECRSPLALHAHARRRQRRWEIYSWSHAQFCRGKTWS
jgi:hypothetical protein